MFDIFKTKIKELQKISKEREKCIRTTIEETGWSREEALKQICDCQRRIGINFTDYRLMKMYRQPVEKQMDYYKKILKKRTNKANSEERNDNKDIKAVHNIEEKKETVMPIISESSKNNSEKQRKSEKEQCIDKTVKATGWDRKYAEEQIKDTRERLGINYRDYSHMKMYAIPILSQEKRYRNYLYRKEVEKKERDDNIHIIMNESGWGYLKAVKNANETCKNLGISLKKYCELKLYRYDLEEQKSILEQNTYEEKNHDLLVVMEKTGWSFEYTEKKYREARKRTGCSAKEYRLYRFYELTNEEQDQVFLVSLSRKIQKKYDNPELITLLKDKELTNQFFDEFVRRPWCLNSSVSNKEFKSIFSNSSRIIYKPVFGHRGFGVEAVELNKKNIDEQYHKLSSLPDGVVEEFIEQHEDMNLLMPDCVNTIRVVSLSSNSHPVLSDGRMMDIAYASVRIGGGGAVVDNFHSGGMVANIDLKTGIIVTDAADMEGNVFVSHPVTGIVFKGFKIPCFQEVLDMVKDAISSKKVEGYIGWDIAISVQGPKLVEVNTSPGVVLLSTPFAAEHKGMKYVMEKYL